MIMSVFIERNYQMTWLGIPDLPTPFIFTLAFLWCLLGIYSLSRWGETDDRTLFLILLFSAPLSFGLYPLIDWNAPPTWITVVFWLPSTIITSFIIMFFIFGVLSILVNFIMDLGEKHRNFYDNR